MDFIDRAIEKRKIRLGAEKAKPGVETEGAEKRDQEIREQVDQFISKMVFPLVCKAKRKLEQNGVKTEVDVETSISIDTEHSYYRGVKLQLAKRLDQKSGVPIVIGPSLYFSASPPYSTTIAIVAYGTDNSAVFSERFDLTEMTEKLVIDHLKMFIEEVIK